METTEIKKVENNQVGSIEINILQRFDLSKELPNLSEAKVLPMDLLSEYWTPESPEEFKLCFYKEIKQVFYTDPITKDVVDLPCVVFIEQTAEGILKTIRNGSKRLVATIEDAVNSGKLAEGTPLKITFKGKEKNATNSFQSDRWSVNPLYVEGELQKLANKESLDFTNKEHIELEIVHTSPENSQAETAIESNKNNTPGF
jgi:hypothetical protein